MKPLREGLCDGNLAGQLEGKLQELVDQFKKDFENVNKENVKDYHVPDFDVSTPMPKVKPPFKDYKFEQEKNKDLGVDTKDKK